MGEVMTSRSSGPGGNCRGPSTVVELYHIPWRVSD